MDMKHAFSLVELSIVLVILGLLTGGILTGQNLIRAAELRSVSTEYQNFSTAIHTFRDKYFALPGDMRNATRFWGDDNAACADAAVANGSPGTCNGNGDGQVANGTEANTTGESFQLWKQLALAGLIEGTYTGLSDATGGLGSTIGSNVPQSKMSNGGYGTYYYGTTVGTAANYHGIVYDHVIIFGAHGGANSSPGGAILKPEEAWNIDTKLDDGKPAYGKVTVRYWNNACATGGATNADLANSVYNLTDTTVRCPIHFIKAY